ncbi:ribonuclease III domain-containing protein, partial [Paraphoma chrysanthemicola]
LTVASVEGITSHTFSNRLLCAEAVQMASPRTLVICSDGFRGVDNNKRLSILEDAVLAKVLCDAWFKARDANGEANSPERWTTLRNEMISNDALAQRGYQLGVDRCVYVAEGVYAKTAKMVATTLEAIVGAVLEDGGDDAVMRVIQHLGFLNHRFL